MSAGCIFLRLKTRVYSFAPVFKALPNLKYTLEIFVGISKFSQSFGEPKTAGHHTRVAHPVLDYRMSKVSIIYCNHKE
jgi:hypothetical protein